MINALLLMLLLTANNSKHKPVHKIEHETERIGIMRSDDGKLVCALADSLWDNTYQDGRMVEGEEITSHVIKILYEIKESDYVADPAGEMDKCERSN